MRTTRGDLSLTARNHDNSWVLLAIDDHRIPTVYDWSLGEGNLFVVMQYFPAGSLADAWAFLGRRDESQVWRLITDLLSALSAAHRAGILHLDLKPSNVLLDGDGGFVLTDFGVSQAAQLPVELGERSTLGVSNAPAHPAQRKQRRE